MMGNNSAAFGIFPSTATAGIAVDRLAMAGFSNQDVSVLLSDRGEMKELAAESNATESATAGAGVGAVLGGTLGLLGGLGAFAIPGLGPLIVAGPIMASLAGFGVGGTVGGFVGALVHIGVPEFEAKQYDGRVKDGGVLLAVRCGSGEEISKARDVLEAVGAEDIASCLEDTTNGAGGDTDRAA